MAIGNFTLTGELTGLDGIPATGRVQIDGIPQVIVDASGNKMRVGPRTLTLDTAGKFTVSLPSNVTTGNSGTIGYRVTVNLRHQNLTPVEFYAPAIGTTLDIADVTPSVVAPVSPFVGPAGPPGPALPAAQIASLAATYVQFRDTNGNPISGKTVTIVVNTTTNEVSDITVTGA